MDLKKIIVLGSSSLLATNFNFIFSNYKIFYFSRENKNHLNNFNKLNIRNLEEVKKKFLLIKPDYVFNFVANTDLQDCEHNDYSYINNIFSNKIAELCLLINSKYILISTDQVYYNSFNRENDKLKLFQKSNYSKDKKLSEDYIKKYLTNYLIIRTNFFNFSKIKKKNIIGHILSNKIIHAYDDFKFKTIYSLDLLEVISFLLNTDQNGIFNIVCDELISKSEFINLVIRTHNLSNTITKINAPLSFRNLRSEVDMNTDKITKIIKLPSLEESIKKLIL